LEYHSSLPNPWFCSGRIVLLVVVVVRFFEEVRHIEMDILQLVVGSQVLDSGIPLAVLEEHTPF
jgi:hypothetical protein